MKSSSVTIQMKAIEQFFPMVLFQFYRYFTKQVLEIFPCIKLQHPAPERRVKVELDCAQWG